MIIAVNGFARAGKDEAARVLVEEFGFTQVAFADKLRDMLYALNPIVGGVVHTKHFIGMDGPLRFPENFYSFKYVQDVIDEYGWGGYKETGYGAEIRRLLQRLGTEAGRQTLWDTIWIDAALANVEGDVVVSDARFINEFDAVTDRGGVVWRINRKGVEAANNHASEMEALTYKKFDKIIHNDGTLEEYRDLIRKAARESRN